MTGISGNKALIGYFVLWGTRQGLERRLLIILISLLIPFFFFFFFVFFLVSPILLLFFFSFHFGNLASLLYFFFFFFFFFLALYFGRCAKTGVGQSMPCCMRTRMLRSHVGFDEIASFQFPFLF
ncbi:hypothetical protein BDV36DRAFT_40630 [Aspergillus pseudocaelatus]|uniref:Uncharacterized protein n=1 Tax=Aspergillus pseudocaelatus TaxID=1825620 RepID=A0ABQ6WCD6_9EURO|nr:hypothetical protein BDV36DRAFT_40630 [Aspergillus pseudocaelatus]